MSDQPLRIDVKTLKTERERLKGVLREVETEQRKVESGLKALRQREIATKRAIEAIETLVDINESDDVAPEKKSKKAQAPAP